MASPRELDPVLAQLVRHPAALDVLDLLAHGPLPLPVVCVRLGVRRRTASTALRTLAAHGLLRRDDQPGSWDEAGAGGSRYELTRPGHNHARLLRDFGTLVAIYEHLLIGAPAVE